MTRTKRFTAAVLAAALVMSQALPVCGAGKSAEAEAVPEAENPDGAAAADEEAAQGADGAAVQEADGTDSAGEQGEGHILNVLSYDSTLKDLVSAYVNGYEAVSDRSGRMIDAAGNEVEIVWKIIDDEDINYSGYLDQVLPGNKEYLPDDRIDLFVADAGLVRKYVSGKNSVALPVSELGIKAEELSNQFPYTQDMVRDEDGVLRGLSYETTAGLMLYRRSAAQTVFGNVRHENVQSYFNSPEALMSAAEELAGYDMRVAATVYDLYPVYDGLRTTPWITDGEVSIDPALERWAKDMKHMIDEGWMTSDLQYGDAWQRGFRNDSSVFAYFGSGSFIENGTHAWDEASAAAAGGWACAEGPVPFASGGDWILAATGTDNTVLDAQIMRTLCCDMETMTNMAVTGGIIVNNRAVLSGLSSDEGASSNILGGQNFYGLLIGQADAVQADCCGPYDGFCGEAFRDAMKDYFNDRMTYEECVRTFGETVQATYRNFHLKAGNA